LIQLRSESAEINPPVVRRQLSHASTGARRGSPYGPAHPLAFLIFPYKEGRHQTKILSVH
jgi:hypothetical protein